MTGRAGTEVATLAGGCFWCLEAVFKEVDGVEDVVSGYTGGTTINPTYQEVCTSKDRPRRGGPGDLQSRQDFLSGNPADLLLSPRPDDVEPAG